MDLAGILEELGLPQPPSGCEALTSAAEEAQRKYDACQEELKKLCERLGIPYPPPRDLPLPPEVVTLIAKCDALKRALDAAIAALKACLLGVAAATCRWSATVLRALTTTLRDLQREITRRPPYDADGPLDPRPKRVVMRLIRMCQYAIAWVKRLRGIMNCPALPVRLPRLSPQLQHALDELAAQERVAALH